jgi:F-type H+-transporting ATPase subunit gamma
VASLKDIRRQISSVKNTQQITKAMKMVAASKLRRAQSAIAGARPYAFKLEETALRICQEILESFEHLEESKKASIVESLNPLLRSKKVSDGEESKTKRAIVIISSDRGLCGAYNTNLLKFAAKIVAEAGKDQTQSTEYYFLGRRGHEYFTKRGVNGKYVNDFWSGRFSPKKSDSLAHELTQRFLSGDLDRVDFVFTQFKSALTQVPEIKQLLPIQMSLNSQSSGSPDTKIPFIYEPGRTLILNDLLPKLIKTSVYRMCAESLASEFAARMTAMDNATRNASEMIADLTLHANRVRQANITKELMEIIGGAEALKG